MLIRRRRRWRTASARPAARCSRALPVRKFLNAMRSTTGRPRQPRYDDDGKFDLLGGFVSACGNTPPRCNQSAQRYIAMLANDASDVYRVATDDARRSNRYRGDRPPRR